VRWNGDAWDVLGARSTWEAFGNALEWDAWDVEGWRRVGNVWVAQQRRYPGMGWRMAVCGTPDVRETREWMGCLTKSRPHRDARDGRGAVGARVTQMGGVASLWPDGCRTKTLDVRETREWDALESIRMGS
jgi:hypothetical protein